MNSKKINTIILDIDRTLIHAVSKYIVKEEWKDKFEWFISDNFIVFLRPHVREFIDFLYNNNYKVGIFTAGSYDHANSVVNNLFNNRKLEFVFSNEQYDEGFDMFGKLKPIEYIVYKHPEIDIDECIIIDDSSLIKNSNGHRCYKINPFCICCDDRPIFISSSEEDTGLFKFIEWIKNKNV